jgi:hypothetical protein
LWSKGDSPHFNPGRKGKKCVKLLKVRKKLVFGEDITMQPVVDLTSKTLMGRFHGRLISEKNLASWIKRVWNLVLGYFSNCHMPVIGWLAFLFNIEEDVAIILKARWFWGSVVLSLKKYVPGFDPRLERISLQTVWVKMRGLSLKLWSVDILKATGDSLGSFLEVDKLFKTDTSRSVPRSWWSCA